MQKIYIYKTNKNKFYFEGDKTFKNTKNKEVLYEIETDAPFEFKKTEIKQEIKTADDISDLLQSIFEEE